VPPAQHSTQEKRRDDWPEVFFLSSLPLFVCCEVTYTPAPVRATERLWVYAGMGNVLKKLFGSKEMRILMLGLDAAGKTSTFAVFALTCVLSRTGARLGVCARCLLTDYNSSVLAISMEDRETVPSLIPLFLLQRFCTSSSWASPSPPSPLWASTWRPSHTRMSSSTCGYGRASVCACVLGVKEN
jgi:hypothetical protein